MRWTRNPDNLFSLDEQKSKDQNLFDEIEQSIKTRYDKLCSLEILKIIFQKIKKIN